MKRYLLPRCSAGGPAEKKRIIIQQNITFIDTRYSMTALYLETVVGPGSKLHLAILVIEWEPGNIHRTRGHEDSWKYFFSITKLSLNTLSLLIHIIAKVAKYFSEIRFVWFNFSSLSPPVRWSMESNDCFVIWAATHLEECKSKSHPHWPPHLWDM